MALLRRTDPLRDLVSLREAMNQLFEDSIVRPGSGGIAPQEGGRLAVDVYETEDSVVVKSAIPGVDPSDIDISIQNDTLTIKGETKAEEKIERKDYLYQEHRYGTFRRSVVLPSGLDTEKTAASFDNGILTLTIPKTKEAKPRQIKVKAKAKAASQGKK